MNAHSYDELVDRIQELKSERKEVGLALRELALLVMSPEEWPGTDDLAEAVKAVHVATKAWIDNSEAESRARIATFARSESNRLMVDPSNEDWRDLASKMYWIEYSCGCSESGSGLPAKPHSHYPMHGIGAIRSAAGGTQASLRALGVGHPLPAP